MVKGEQGPWGEGKINETKTPGPLWPLEKKKGGGENGNSLEKRKKNG
jgi:hypothetical protein